MAQSSVAILGYYEDIIDCTSIGDVEIIYLNQRFVCMDMTIELNLVSGLVSCPTISVGTNSINYDNVLSPLLLTQTNVNDISIHRIPISLDGSSSLKVNITNAANATEYQIKVLITGYFE